MIDGRKVCGVLIESPSGTLPTKNRLIIGIGINVNNSWRSAPRDFGPNGTALCDVTGMRHDLQYVLIGTLREMNERFLQLARSDSRLPDTWQKHCWLTEQDVDVHAGDRWFTGVCLGIDSDGALIVDDKNGVHRIRSGSVRVV
jgi:BirA family biotin operon repressor/biotin-[acetyl-CoA-carboxylase] ligase